MEMRKDLKKFIPFCMVGGVGFLVDAGLLVLMVRGLGVGPLVGRLVSFPCAMTVTWYLNRRITFSGSAKGNIRKEWIRYAVVSFAGNLVNFIVYAACISFSESMYDYPELALAIAATVALVFNYIGSSRYVFRKTAGD
jgi:putative flippase GtrA